MLISAMRLKIFHYQTYPFMAALNSSTAFLLPPFIVLPNEFYKFRDTSRELAMLTLNPKGKACIYELRLSDIGIDVLGVQKSGGNYIAAPTGTTYVDEGDKLPEETIMTTTWRKTNPGRKCKYSYR